jgi:putative ABC transport system permease protein
VVGVVRDTRDFGAGEEQAPVLYLSHAQYPISMLQFVVHATRAPETLTAPLREAIAAVDPQIPVFEIETMESRFSESIAQPRFLMTLLALFAFTAIVLASIGLYGVIAHGVSERTREIGIRMALGARQRDVLGMIMRRGWGLGVSGIAFGLVAAFAGARLLRAQLYGVQPIDPLTLASAVLILMPVALLASWIPARRAARVDPAITLRME